MKLKSSKSITVGWDEPNWAIDGVAYRIAENDTYGWKVNEDDENFLQVQYLSNGKWLPSGDEMIITELMRGIDIMYRALKKSV